MEAAVQMALGIIELQVGSYIANIYCKTMVEWKGEIIIAERGQNVVEFMTHSDEWKYFFLAKK